LPVGLLRGDPLQKADPLHLGWRVKEHDRSAGVLAVALGQHFEIAPGLATAAVDDGQLHALHAVGPLARRLVELLDAIEQRARAVIAAGARGPAHHAGGHRYDLPRCARRSHRHWLATLARCWCHNNPRYTYCTPDEAVTAAVTAWTIWLKVTSGRAGRARCMS